MNIVEVGEILRQAHFDKECRAPILITEQR